MEGERKTERDRDRQIDKNKDSYHFVTKRNL